MSQKLLKIGPDIAQLVRISRPAWRCEGYNQPLERERLPRHSAVPTLSSSLTQPSSRRTNSGAQLRGREGPQLDKHGQCVTIPVCAQEGDFWGGEGRVSGDCESGVAVKPLVPSALCTVLIHPSQTSSNHRAPSPHAGPPSTQEGLHMAVSTARPGCMSQQGQAIKPTKEWQGRPRVGIHSIAPGCGKCAGLPQPQTLDTVTCRRSY